MIKMSTNESLKERRLAFLNETISHFNSKNRAYDKERQACSYSHKVNGGCAIGRKVSAELAEEFEAMSRAQEQNAGLSVGATDIFKKLPTELQELGSYFLELVQSLHDGDIYWDENGLSRIGEKKVENIKAQLELN